MITAQVTSIGNDLSIIFAPEVLRKLHVVSGDHVCVIETADGVELRRLDPELAEQLAAADVVMREDDAALRRLAE